MKTIVLTNRYAQGPFGIVSSLVPEGFELRMPEESSYEAVSRLIPEADYLLASGRVKVDGALLDRAPRLRMIQRTGVGLDTLDLEAIKSRNLPLYVNRGVNARSVAEYALLLTLACLRKLTIAAENTKNGVWSKQAHGIQTHELSGKTVGIVGMGFIARTLVALLRPFGVKILYSDVVRAPEEFEKENGAAFVTLDELLRNADVVTLHCALTDETRSLIGKEAFDKMKPEAVLINTARGGIVDTDALADALEKGRIAFAGIDVHEKEPIPEDYRLKNLPNVILTPHIAGVTRDSFRAMMEGAFRNMSMFEAGKTAEIKEYRYL